MSNLTQSDVLDLIERDDVPLKYLSLRMGQGPFWALYYECNPGMRGAAQEVASFVCPPGITVTLERLFGREGWSMDVADQYYADVEAGILPKPKAISAEDEANVLGQLRDLLNEATVAGALPNQQPADDDPVELERLRAEALAELDVAHEKLEQAKQRAGTKPPPKGCAGALLFILACAAIYWLL